MASEEGAVVESQVTQSKYSKRVVLKSILGRSDGGLGLIGERVLIGGWVKSSREQRKDLPLPLEVAVTKTDVTCVEIFQSRIPLFRTIMKALTGSHSPIRGKLEAGPAKPPPPSIAYLQVNDGSCIPSLQVVVESSVAPLGQLTPMGTSILTEGVLGQTSVTGKQVIELKVERILHIGSVDHGKYPLAKTRVPLDILRGYSHLRPRTTTVASVTRLRYALTHATHTFFQNHGFLHVHIPVITMTDSKGFSAKFHVTTLFGEAYLKEGPKVMDDTASVNLEIVKAAIKEKSNKVEELKRSDSNKEALFAALQDLRKTNELALQLEVREKSKPIISVKTGEVDFTKDYFGCQTYLTVSGQLHLESYACALGSVYTLGPTFRAEKSQPTKHLAESWMVELEMAFADLEDVMNCAEDYLKFLCQWVLENCSDDMNLMSKRIDKTSIDYLHLVVSNSFEQITYTEAVELLKVTGKTFEVKIEWGVALTEEHESYLADEIYRKPVIIYNYPKEVKPFYMRLNDDGKTVSAIDIVVPKVGTLIRGGQREERFNMLSTRIKELGLPREQYDWYLDLRRHGTVEHSGFSLEFDHLVLLASGLSDIRDVIPFPRSIGNVNN